MVNGIADVSQQVITGQWTSAALQNEQTAAMATNAGRARRSARAALATTVPMIELTLTASLSSLKTEH
jgi:hypothetical protein